MQKKSPRAAEFRVAEFHDGIIHGGVGAFRDNGEGLERRSIFAVRVRIGGDFYEETRPFFRAAVQGSERPFSV